MTTTIRSTGTGETRVPAEFATVTARVSVTSRDRSESIGEASRAHNSAVRRAEQLRESGDAVWHMAAPISTRAHRSHADGAQRRSVVEYTTSSRVSVKLSNLELVSELVAEFSEEGFSTDVDWSLAEASRRESERGVRRAAVGEARAVADDYAEALGRRIVAVVSISDADGGGFQPQPRFAAASAFAGDPAEVTVPEIAVRASVAGVYETD